MKTMTGLLRSTLGALALATLLVAPLGCAGVDEEGEVVGEAAQAISGPYLTASPGGINFGTITSGTISTLPLTLTNIGEGNATAISLAVPPDPYYRYHNPPGYLGAGLSSSLTQISFRPTTTGFFSENLVFTYRDVVTTSPLQTFTVQVTGTAN